MPSGQSRYEGPLSDPETGKLAQVAVANRPVAIAAGLGSIWVVNSESAKVTRIDPRTVKVVGKPIQVGASPAGIAVGAGAVWVTNSDDSTVTRIDP